MKTVYFIRHAKSSWKDFSLRDFDRPLNKRGFRDAPFMAEKLLLSGAKPDALISSPANRALTTAGFFARTFGFESAEIIQEASIYEAFPDTILHIIRTLPDKLNTVFLFGHNPGFTMVANGFGGDHISNIPTCGIVRVEAATDHWAEFSAQTGKITHFFFPKKYLDQ